jgi:acyl-CoA thioesterase-2
MPVGTLVEAMRLHEAEGGTFTAANYELGERGVVFGGQLIGQLIAAASRLDAGKSVKAIHAMFARPVLVADDVTLQLDALQNGRNFASGTVSIHQDGTERARALALLTADERDLIRHADAMPDVPSPSDVDPGPSGQADLRVLGGVDFLDAEQVGEPTIAVWKRHPEATGDRAIAQALVAHTSASFLIGAAMRPHRGFGQSAAHAAFSTGIIGHSMSFHEPFDAREWMLFVQHSSTASRGRAYGTGQVFDQSGLLVASFSQESMIRHFPEGMSPVGRETTVL